MATNLQVPGDSEISARRIEGNVVIRWPAPANWFEKIGPDRVFALTTAVCGPAALVVFFIDPLWSVVFLFAILAGAGVRGAPSRLTGLEEIELTEDALVVRRDRGAGLFTRAKPRAPARRLNSREAARFGRAELQAIRIEPGGGGQELLLVGKGTRLAIGRSLHARDQAWLQAFVQDWVGM